jgi:AcrR family transcriptional regulator
MRSLASEARAARHTAVVDEATIEFNRAGVAQASLATIAGRVGLTRAGLYNYCADRQDLVFQCYQRACELTQEDLQRAYHAPADGLERLGVFLKQSVDIQHTPVAVLSELAFLSQKQQAAIRQARAENVTLLKLLLTEGQKDGSIRSCDLDVVCQAIFGLLSWIPLTKLWSKRPDDTFARRMAAAIPGMVMEGVVPEDGHLPDSHKRIADVIQKVDRSEKEQRLEDLARAGSMLFNRRGIDGVSLDDIALELGATKGVLYHYFSSKPAFVAFCYERAFDIYDRIMDVAETGSTGLECTMLAIELDVEAQLTDIHPLWLTTGLGMFRPKIQEKLAARSVGLAARSFDLARRGVVDGSLRPFDLEPVKLAAPGSFTYLSAWLPQGDARWAAEVACEISRFLLLGLRQRRA